MGQFSSPAAAAGLMQLKERSLKVHIVYT